jgi:hypothetical protein
MIAAGGPIVFLALLLGVNGAGNLPHDLVSLMDINDYFTPRSIETKPDNLVRLAGKAPADAKESLVQLLAIRWLGENVDQLGDQKDAARKALQQLARGPEGFPRDYAEVALARLEGKAPPVRAFPKDSLRKEAFSWFPEKAQMVAAAVEFRAMPGRKNGGEHDQAFAKQFKEIQAHLQKLIPNQAKDEIYIGAETVGNVRIDRLSFAMSQDPENRGNEQIFARATGRFNHKNVVDYLRTLPNLKIDEKKGPKGEARTYITFGEPPAFVLVGDTDVLIAGHGNKKEGNIELAEQALAVRDGKKPSMLKGPLGKTLETVSPDASGVLITIIPPEARGAAARTPVGVIPHQIMLESIADNAGEGFNVRFRGEMDNEADAKKFADGFKDLIKMGLDELKNAPAVVPGLDIIKQVLETIQGVDLKADGAKVGGELRVTPDIQKSLLEKAEEAVKKLTDS